jgi:lipopolysaccharide/colanic/teichoic acid biosynthesis glycosyltransferase
MSEWFIEPHFPRYQASEGDHLLVRYPWLERFDPKNRRIKGAEYLLVKRIMDLVLVCLIAPIWLFIFLLTALLIKLEEPNGTITFHQERTGKSGRRFKMYKFRTMVMDAEQIKKELAHLNELQWPDFKISNDPRITRIGRLLRKTSLDELPQIINVIRGEMSLVGPRPTSFSAETYALWQTERLDVIPGVTGLWQLLGRGETEFDERLRMDIAYIERRSIRLDIQILWRTLFAVLKQRGAK